MAIEKWPASENRNTRCHTHSHHIISMGIYHADHTCPYSIHGSSILFIRNKKSFKIRYCLQATAAVYDLYVSLKGKRYDFSEYGSKMPSLVIESRILEFLMVLHFMPVRV